MNDRFEKDARLGEDIRLLGRILGDTIRAYEGEAAFALVEDIRQLAVAARRLDDVAAAERLSKALDGLSAAEAVMVIRAFSYFEEKGRIGAAAHNRFAGGKQDAEFQDDLCHSACP